MKKQYTAKTVQDAVNNACEELGVTIDELNYEVISETKTLFIKKATIECYTIPMIQEFIESYIRRFISDMGFEIETVSYLQDGRIYCNINTSNNSILIGKAGVILRAINFIVKNARFGKQVQRTKTDIKLDPMPADERKVMHQELAKFNHVKTESHGEGKNRHMVISYVK